MRSVQRAGKDAEANVALSAGGLCSLTPRAKNPSRGITLLELLLAVLLTGIVMISVQNLLLASWRSADDLIWQNRVNQEARQALDDICDAIRASGDPKDMISPQQSTFPQIKTGSSQSILICVPTNQGQDGNTIRYEVLQSKALSAPYLVRTVTSGYAPDQQAIASFVDKVTFEYEYRLPAVNGSKGWLLRRVANPDDPSVAANVPYLVSTIYVTVEAQVQPYGANGSTYRRQLTSAVHPRAPYNETVPPAQRFLPH